MDGDYDYDDDGLIEVRTLEQLRATRLDPEGTGFVQKGRDEYFSAWSAVVSQTTPAGPPSSPFLRAEPDGDRSIVLTWDEPSNNGADLTSYEVQVSADGGTTWRRLVSPNRSLRTHTHRGLSAGTTRHYQVRASNRVGKSEYSNVASATTLAGVPNAPVLTARATGPRSYR